MIEENGICYADDQRPMLKILEARFLGDWEIEALFNNGERRIADLSPLLAFPAFTPLTDLAEFRSGHVDFGTLTWRDGSIDIAPEWVYEHGLAEVEKHTTT